jgi:hypothetical protein
MRWVMLQKWVVKGEHMGELLFKNEYVRHLDQQCLFSDYKEIYKYNW